MLKRILVLLGLVFSLGCLYAILSRADLSQLKAAAGSIRWPWVILCFAGMVAQLWLRAVRWKY